MQIEGTIDERRKAELEAGRERASMRAEQVDDGQDFGKLQADADKELEEDEKRREAILDTTAQYNKVDADRAGAEIADQAQTELEAILHLIDVEQKITTVDDQQAAETMEHELSDPGLATELTVAHVTAQAVNQPTPLAHEDGEDTENLPLTGAFGFTADEMSPRTKLPKDKHVPKTVGKARSISKQKVPDAAEVVVPGWHEPWRGEENSNVAVDAVAKVPDEALGPSEAP